MYYATAKELEKLDQLAVKNGLEIRQMMELAGFYILEVFRRLKITSKSKVTVVCGKGNKAGDGLCAARHLLNSGYKVTIVLLSPKISENSQHQLRLLQKMGAPIFLYSKEKTRIQKIINSSDILIDALIGYRLQGAPRGIFKEAIKMMNKSQKRIVAYDLPSGLDPTSGYCHKPCIKAWVTFSLALPKRGFKFKEAQKFCGKIFLGDIGVPKFLYEKIAPKSQPPFHKNSLLLI